MTIPGPNPPVYHDSYISVILEHLAALQKDGLPVWDAAQGKMIIDRPFLAYAGADRVAHAPISGSAGHHARYGCRTFCDVRGRHKPGQSAYYPAFKKPDDLDEERDRQEHGDLDYHGQKTKTKTIVQRFVSRDSIHSSSDYNNYI